MKQPQPIDLMHAQETKRELAATGRDVYNLIPMLAFITLLFAFPGNEPTQKVGVLIFCVHMTRVLAVHVWTWRKLEAEAQARQWAHEEFERTKCRKCNGSGIDGSRGLLDDCPACKGEGVQPLQAVQ